VIGHRCADSAATALTNIGHRRGAWAQANVTPITTDPEGLCSHIGQASSSLWPTETVAERPQGGPFAGAFETLLRHGAARRVSGGRLPLPRRAGEAPAIDERVGDWDGPGGGNHAWHLRALPRRTPRAPAFTARMSGSVRMFADYHAVFFENDSKRRARPQYI